MTSAGIGFSTQISPRRAARQAAECALEGMGSGPVEAALLFATSAWGPQLSELIDEAGDLLDARVMAGATVAGLFSGKRGTANNPGVAILTLAGVRAEGLLLDRLAGAEAGAAAELLERLGDPPGPEDLVLFFADSVALVPDAMFSGARARLGDGTAFGVGASASPGGTPRVWCDGELADSALAGLVVRGAGRPRWGVARAGRALNEPLTVTRSRDHWVKSLDQKRATDVFEDVARRCGITDSAEARRHLVVSIEAAGPAESPLVQSLRDIVGLDPRRGSLALPIEVPTGSRLTFILRDRVAARENLEALVGEHSKIRPRFGLFLAPESEIPAAGAGVSGTPARCLEAGFPGVPILGLHCGYPMAASRRTGVEFGPLHHCSVLALIEGRGTHEA